MFNKIKNKIKGEIDRFNQFRYQSHRPNANKLFSEISGKANGGGQGSILCEALWDNPHHYLRVAMLRNAMSEMYGNKLIGVRLDTANKRIIDSLRSLQLTSEEVLPTKVADSYVHRAQKILNNYKTTHQMVNDKLEDGFPCSAFYDGVLKSERLGKLDPSHPKLPYYLGLTLQFLDCYKRIFDKYDIRAVIVSHPTHFRFSTLIWIAINQKIPVYLINYRNDHITLCKLETKYDFMSPSHHPGPEVRDMLSTEMRSRLIRVGRDYLDTVLAGTASEYAYFNIYKGKNEKYKDRDQIAELIGSDKHKPNIVIFTNCWPDFPNAQGPCYFTDYQEWFTLTYKSIINMKQYNWIIKPHPAESFFGDRVTLKSIVGDKVHEGIYIWPEEISGNALFNFADCVISARGSAGIEYPAIGKRTLTAAPTSYTSWGFVNYTDSVQDYIESLQKSAFLPEPTQKQREDALIFIALVYCSPPEIQNDGYSYPAGISSHRIWPKLPLFIKKNMENINREISMMHRWLHSKTKSYNAYKHLNYETW